MCPHVVPCVSSYHLAPTKWTQNHSEALKRDQIRARTRQNHEESQGETGKKPQKHLRSCQNHSETIKKHEKPSKTTPNPLKSTPKASKREPEPSQRHRNTSSFLGKPTKGPHKGIQAVSQGSRSSRNTPKPLKINKKHSKTIKIHQISSKSIKIHEKPSKSRKSTPNPSKSIENQQVQKLQIHVSASRIHQKPSKSIKIHEKPSKSTPNPRNPAHLKGQIHVSASRSRVQIQLSGSVPKPQISCLSLSKPSKSRISGVESTNYDHSGQNGKEEESASYLLEKQAESQGDLPGSSSQGTRNSQNPHLSLQNDQNPARPPKIGT